MRYLSERHIMSSRSKAWIQKKCFNRKEECYLMTLIYIKCNELHLIIRYEPRSTKHIQLINHCSTFFLPRWVFFMRVFLHFCFHFITICSAINVIKFACKYETFPRNNTKNNIKHCLQRGKPELEHNIHFLLLTLIYSFWYCMAKECSQRIASIPVLCIRALLLHSIRIVIFPLYRLVFLCSF